MATISRSPSFDFVLTFLDEKELEQVKDLIKAAVTGISASKENDAEVNGTIEQLNKAYL